MRKKFLVALLTAVVLFTATLSSCSNPGGVDSSSKDSAAADSTGSATAADDGLWHPEKPVALRWTTWEHSTTEGQNYLEKSFALYKKYQPDITVEYEYIPNDQYQTWLQTQLMGGTAPELFLVRHAWGQQYLRDGTVIDLTDYLENETNPYYNNQNWLSTFQESVIVQVLDLTNGKYASVPTNGVLCKLFYNIDLFKKVGLEKPPATFEELLDACKKLQDNNIMPMVVGMKVSEGGGFHWYERFFMDPLATQFVDELDLNDTGLIEVNEIARGVDKDIINITKSPWKDIYPLIKELSQYWHPGYNAMDNAEAREQFLRGNVAMIFDVGTYAKNFHDNPDLGFEFGITEFPTLTKESHPQSSEIAYEIGGAPQGNICIPSNISDETKLKAAIDFLKFKTGIEDATLYVEECWGVIPLKGITIKSDNPLLKALQFKNGVSPLKLYETYFDRKFWDDSVMLGQLYLKGEITLEEYTKTLQDDLVVAKDAYVQKEGWSDENNWGEGK